MYHKATALSDWGSDNTYKLRMVTLLTIQNVCRIATEILLCSFPAINQSKRGLSLHQGENYNVVSKQ